MLLWSHGLTHSLIGRGSITWTRLWHQRLCALVLQACANEVLEKELYDTCDDISWTMPCTWQISLVLQGHKNLAKSVLEVINYFSLNKFVPLLLQSDNMWPNSVSRILCDPIIAPHFSLQLLLTVDRKTKCLMCLERCLHFYKKISAAIFGYFLLALSFFWILNNSFWDLGFQGPLSSPSSLF